MGIALVGVLGWGGSGVPVHGSPVRSETGLAPAVGDPSARYRHQLDDDLIEPWFETPSVVVGSGPDVGTLSSADPLGLLHGYGLGRAVSLGTDRIALWVCDVPAGSTDRFYAQFGGSRVAVDGPAVAAHLQAATAGWFATASQGRYTATFTAVGRIALSTSEGPNDCLVRAVAASGPPYTNVLAVDTVPCRCGFAGPGTVRWSGGQLSGADLSSPPSSTRRAAWVGGGAVTGDAFVVLHELGHTLHWPHSFLGPSEYDNPVDIMSGAFGPVHTLAINRYASGWIDPAQVHVHRSGVRELRLTPPGSSGTQLLVLPGPTDLTFATVEARPARGIDAGLRDEGLAVHLVDQRQSACGAAVPGGCPGIWRRQGQAVGPAGGRAHVLRTGEQLTVNGATVRVDGVDASGSYTVTVRTGTTPLPSVHEPLVRAAHQDLLGRAPTAAEVQHWVGRLDTGLAVHHFLQELADSDAWLGATIDQMYRDTLGRAGDGSGRAYWIDRLRRRQLTVAAVAALFYASEEYYGGRGGADPDRWVNDLYVKLLGRGGDPDGVRHWASTSAVNGRPVVALLLYQSEESRRVRVRALYQRLLGRDPDPGGHAYWAAQVLQRGDLTLAVDLAASPEYAARAAARFG
jgi:hypothetical protein